MIAVLIMIGLIIGASWAIDEAIRQASYKDDSKE